jgi:hypothetical protein
MDGEMFHVYSQFISTNSETKRRQKLAQASWSTQCWDEFPVKNAQLPRVWNEPGRSLPFLKDLLALACKNAPASGIVVYTNADICVRSNASSVLAAAFLAKEACYAFRRDFARLDGLLADEQIAQGHDYCGSDLFAFRVRWWKDHARDFPDMLIATEAWDAVFRCLIEAVQPAPDNAIPNLIYHERHESQWENPKQRYSLASQQHNLKLAWEWMVRRGVEPHRFGIRKV